MSKDAKPEVTPVSIPQNIEKQEEAFEMIELALDDINLLTRAFEVIEGVCKELNAPEFAEDEDVQEVTVH